MKPVVVSSWEDPGGTHCVDVLSHDDGSFGFTLCRRDPDDGHGWRHLGDPLAVRFLTRAATEDAARAAAPWVMA